MERVAPRQILYENQLPLAIESKSQRRLFFPEGGSEYGPTGGTKPNIIRIPINADSLLDVQHSYLQFVLRADTDAAASLAPDVGVPFIRRLRIESSGTTLEDIEEYGKLYGGVLFPAQASSGAVMEAQVTTAGIGGIQNTLTTITANAGATAITDGAAATAVLGAFTGDGTDENARITAAKAAATTVIQDLINAGLTAQNAALVGKLNARTVNGAAIAAYRHNGSKADDAFSNALAGQTERTYNVPIVSALFNMEKYLPLVMMNAGLTLELELDVAGSAGLQDANGATTLSAGDEVPEWTIKDVRYVAHLIDLQRDFYDRMRMVMEGSGGVLQLAGTTFRHFSQFHPANAATDYSINIPARVKSIKSVFFTMSNSGAKNAVNEYHTDSLPNGIDEYQFRVGSVVYPPTSIKVKKTGNLYTNKGESYQELRKAFGTLGDYSHGGVGVNSATYLAASDTAVHTGCNAYSFPHINVFGLDFQSFGKTMLENGINTADRSLPMTLDIKRTDGPAGTNIVTDVWVMCDAIFYVNLDGSVSVSI